MKTSLSRRLVAEFFGTAFLVAAVVGSGVMAERLSNGNAALALLANTIATGAALVALILTFGPISGAHFNPAVTLADAIEGGLVWVQAWGYIIAQIIGGLTGTVAAHLMFGLSVVSLSRYTRSGGAQFFSEFVATFGLLSVIWGCSRLQSAVVPFAVGAYITAAYWFTASTSFANPAVTIARSFSDTFAGIRPADAPLFIVAQILGALASTFLFRWLVPNLARDAGNVVVAHDAAVTEGAVRKKEFILLRKENWMSSENIKEIVREKYGEAAKRVSSGAGSACCGTSPSSSIEGCDPITSNLYGVADAAIVPEAALQASLGCGNPTALAKLQPGETVLDLGSGGGIDVLLSARRVGPTGKAFGLDMTDEMLAIAEENKRKSSLTNVEFLKGEIENIPLPDNTVDVIVSNCVINLSGDKDRVLQEAFRVLKPGGRFAVSDVVVRGEVPTEIRKSMELWVGCVAGALSDRDYRQKLAAAGFEAIDIEATRVYNVDDAREFLGAAGIDADSIAPKVQDKFISAFVRARKPAKADACCESTCCASEKQ